MPFAAITYDIKPGCEAELAEIFGNFRRVKSDRVRGEGGEAAGRILATAVFLRDDTLVRVIEYEGDLDAVARHMASQPGVREVERKLKPYLTRSRDTDTVEGFVATFRRSLLRTVAQISVRDLSAAS
ncbi:SchA/CurD-like domain-containing protein [Streptomyces griseofuscus]|uniref:SchA/CurD n=1 Tax=Streptomyces griseofuscus TaxID=146922 RepID=A0A3R8WXD1_9ACTN|nr:MULTISPECIES: SchA/CurD-like domain-containing protein [Streptomyces]MBJ6999565.1 SchA/CurD [Streptomyces sp. CRPSP2-6A1]MYQ94968.1 SchA/CurD [Streptomyces sp. SID4946]MYR89307.1 SchA/CurD [Streptomyces sp. SID685]RRQ88654.1 SchA/CurD [Streptomyces griseofuscus]SCF92712.1 SchA/CurD like domain-containing protein [Streptomyces sp. DconLS]